ncbi:unnamed protein product [Calypogeia fissa]
MVDYGREKTATTYNRDKLDTWPVCATYPDSQIVLDIGEGAQGSPMVWVPGDHIPLGPIEAGVIINLDTPLSEPLLPPPPVNPEEHRRLEHEFKSIKMGEPVEEEPMQAKLVEEEPVEEEPMQTEPVEEEPVEKEPMQAEPVEEEPVEEEPMQAEPVEEELVEDELAKELADEEQQQEE